MKLAKFRGLELDPSKISESTTVQPIILPENKKVLTESSEGLPKVLLPRIEAIHAGRTRNFNRYLSEKLKGDASLKSGVYSWLHPYPKPVIYNHDTETQSTGRVYNAAWTQHTRAGRDGIIVIPKITDPDAIQKILDGRLLTVSIGATTDAAVCSICGTDILEEGWCGHEKGQEYDGIMTEWIAGNLFFDELSWVNVPADSDAMVIDSGLVGMAEAYTANGNEIIDLGKKQTEWVLTKELAMAEGLVPTEEPKGETTLTIEELQAKVGELETQVEELTSSLEQVTSEKNDLASELETTKESLATAQTDLEAKSTELAEKSSELEAKTTEAEEANSAKEAAEGQVTELTQTVEALETEKTALMETNTQLSSENHKILAERVVDLKVALGKESKRDEAVEAHVGRSTESLKDTLVDLLKESASVAPKRQPESLGNPAGGVHGKEHNGIVEGAGANGEGEKKLTAEQVLTNMLTGRHTNKK